MNEIVRLENFKGELLPITDSLKVSEVTEKRHSDVMKDIRELINKLSSNDETRQIAQRNFTQCSYINSNNREMPMYVMTKEGFENLIFTYNGTKMVIVKAKFIRKFHEMEEKLKNNINERLPTTYKEALQQLLIEVEEKEQLQLENQEMKPKAEYFDALVDRNLLTNVRDTAKELGVKERVFTRWLVQNKFCYRDKRNKLKPYAEKKKYFELKEFATQYGHADVQMLINPKGREAFRLLLIKDGLIASDYEQVCMIG